MTKNQPTDPFFCFAKREDAEIQLATGALLIAQSEYIALKIEDYLCRLDEMASVVRERIQDTTLAEHHIAALNRYLFEENGFTGNTENYYALGNNFLNAVLDNKTGIPITLGVVYIEVGRRAGLPLVGVNFPGHFLVKYQCAHLDIHLDVFKAGRFMREDLLQAKLKEVVGTSVPLEPQMLAEASDREILARILRNLVRAYTLLERYDKALIAAERITWLLPNTATDYRLLGYLHYKNHAYGEGIAAFEKYLQIAEAPPDAAAIERNIQHLHKLLSRLN
ncbi:MAG: transglutaminase-like domain-containing protein [Candidatus Poribacteria bacterium]|nr:transglutaminase-like domain-containing protein [Candidatus Poribacteria bacterium]